MKKILIGLTIIVFNSTFLCSNAFSAAEMFPAASFVKLKATVEKMAKLPHTLVVMDDDDTLTMMSCPNQNDKTSCQYLGGPAWYSWQENLSNDSKFKVANNFNDLLDISALLLAMNQMNYTENNIPNILHSLTNSGVKLLVLTARGSSNLSATESQFKNRKVDGKKYVNFLDLIKQNALLGTKSGIASIAGPFMPENCKINPAISGSVRPVSYQQGVMYVAGQNKGAMLQCLLDQTDSSKIKNIVFIDDTLANVEDVYASFESSTKYNVKAIHYTKLQKHKQALTKGISAEEFQNNARKRWNAIKATLKKELQAPAFPQQ